MGKEGGQVVNGVCHWVVKQVGEVISSTSNLVFCLYENQNSTQDWNRIE